MNAPIETPKENPNEQPPTDQPLTSQSAEPGYVKLAMRNMVRKKSKSLSHFFLMTVGLLGLLIGISYLTR